VTDTLTIPELIERAIAGYAELTTLGEDIEDEWSYVNDLSAAWTTRLEEVAAARGVDEASPAEVEAIDRALDEITAISDPHRAIDWLSTFPQLVLVALGERP
jgi:hypothetical protein